MRTARLTLVAASPELLAADIAGDGSLGGLLAAVVPASWPPGLWDLDAMRFFLERLRTGGEAAAGWYGWYALAHAAQDADATLVGSGGYFGPPGPGGEVEIGYSVLPEHCGRGFATEMVGALVARAFATPGVTCVRAEADDDNVASHVVLERNGFRRAGAGSEPGRLGFRREPAVPGS